MARRGYSSGSYSYAIGPVLEELGAELPHRHGGGWQKMLCPFHPDTAPSATVNFEANRFQCWVGCTDRAEDAIGLLMLHGGFTDFQSAQREAERISGSSGGEVRRARGRGNSLFGKSWNG